MLHLDAWKTLALKIKYKFMTVKFIRNIVTSLKFHFFLITWIISLALKIYNLKILVQINQVYKEYMYLDLLGNVHIKHIWNQY